MKGEIPQDKLNELNRLMCEKIAAVNANPDLRGPDGYRSRVGEDILERASGVAAGMLNLSESNPGRFKKVMFTISQFMRKIVHFPK